MRFLILAAAVGAIGATAIPATAANAQSWRGGYGYHQGYNQRDVRQEQRECRRELRRARTQREYRRELRECRREIAAAQRGYRGYDRRYDYRDRGRHRDGYGWRNRW